MNHYIASCVFTAQYPELSGRIQRYMRERWGFSIVRCCVPAYKLREFESKMPEGEARKAWSALPDSADFQPGDAVYSLCHNCNNIIEETHPGTQTHSLWELIDGDDQFAFPDHSGLVVTIQDCWRARDRREEQAAARSLLRKMNIRFVETEENREKADFCGCSLYRAQPPRNPKLAPKHYVEGAQGKFVPHSAEAQRQIMRQYCSRYPTETVVCYCHYCLEGLLTGGVDGRHIAQLLFPERGHV